MKAILEFNFSEADGLDNDADVLLCLKARAMHRLLQDLQEYVEGRLQGAGAGGTNALQELEALRGWLVEEIQDNEIPGL